MAYIHQINRYDPQNDGGFNAPTVSIYFNKCSFKCKGCWNPQTWERKEELYRSNEEIIEELSKHIERYLNKQFNTVGLSILGGDPIIPDNANDTLEILTELRNRYGSKLKVCLWTGYVYERLVEKSNESQQKVLSLIDRIVDGPFILSKKTDPSDGKMFGSTNQRVLDKKENCLFEVNNELS